MARRSAARRNPSGDKSLTRAIRVYSDLHDGLLPEKHDYVRIRLPRYLVHLGKERATEYERRVDDDGDGVANEHPELYRHPFADGAGSDIFYDEKGQRWLFGGANKVTDRGITDMKRRKSFLHGYIPRVNPDLTNGQIVVRGLGTALIAVGANRAMDTVFDPFFSSSRTRSLVKTAVGAAIGIGIYKRYPFIGAGFVAAAGLELVQLAYGEFGIDRVGLGRSRVEILLDLALDTLLVGR